MKQKTILGSTDIEQILDRIADDIFKNQSDLSKVALVGIHTRGVFLAERIRKILEKRDLRIVTGNIDINLYRDDWTRISHHPEVRGSDIPFTVHGMEIILVDDVLFTGRTIRAAMEAIMDYGRPDRIELCVLIDRGHRELPIQANYTGMSLDTEKSESVNVLLSERDGEDRVDVLMPD